MITAKPTKYQHQLMNLHQFITLALTTMILKVGFLVGGATVLQYLNQL